jgi:Flp pilus assembly secretin CpaC
MNRQEFLLSKELNLKESIHKIGMNRQERIPSKELNHGEIIVHQEIQIQLTIIMLQETVTKELNIPIICFKTRFI